MEPDTDDDAKGCRTDPWRVWWGGMDVERVGAEGGSRSGLPLQTELLLSQTTRGHMTQKSLKV